MEDYARLTGRNKSHVVMEAVGEYLAWRMPQVEDLQVAITEADAGQFASESEVAAVFARHTQAPAKAKTKATQRRGR